MKQLQKSKVIIVSNIIIIKDKGLVKYTDNTITDVEEFNEHLKLIRQNGYALDYEEYGKGIICFSAPTKAML